MDKELIQRQISGMEEALKFDASRIVENGFPQANMPLLTSSIRKNIEELKARLEEETMTKKAKR